MNNDEIILFIKLKYGNPCPSEKYFKSLPSSVVDDAFRAIHHDSSIFYYKKDYAHTRSRILSIMLRQPVNKEAASQAIFDALCRYHKINP